MKRDLAMGDDFKPEDLLIIARRRFWFFVAPIALLAPLGVLVALMLPAKYTAVGRMLVESQQISEDLVRSTVTTYARERIQVIRQRVMTRERLLQIADDFDLFADQPDMSDTQRVSAIRERLVLDLISVNPGNRRRDVDSTIAFTVSYTDGSPRKAFAVANEFMTLFQTEDAKTRTRGATETTEFFVQETKRLRSLVDSLETQIAGYKDANSDALPEYLDMHAQQLDRASNDLAAVQTAILSAEEDMRALELELASYLAGGDGEDGPAQEISRLKAALAALRADKTDAHPDVRALRDQIGALEAQLQPSAEITRLRQALDAADAALREARGAVEPDAEEIAGLAEAAKVARQRLSAQLSREASNGANDFIGAQLQGRIEVAANRLDALNEQADTLRARVVDLRARIARTPDVQRGLQILRRDYENLDAQYNQVLAKQQQAIIAENLEEDQKAEKFIILEAAVLPDEPSSPERGKLIFLALLGAVGVGGVAAVGAELLNATVRGRDHITALTNEAPIAVIPYIRTENERRRPRWMPSPPRVVAARLGRGRADELAAE